VTFLSAGPKILANILKTQAGSKMPEESVPVERLDSWKAIAGFLGRDIRTVIRWEKEKGLPVHRVPGGQRQGVFAYRGELENWLAGTTGAARTEPAQDEREGAVPSSAVFDPLEEARAVPAVAGAEKNWWWSWRMLVHVVLLLALLLIAGAYRYGAGRFSIRPPQLIGLEQLTANNREKSGLLINGKNLIFGQEQDGWYSLAAMPLQGGEIRLLWSPQANVRPLDISPDGERVLARTTVGVEDEGELWIVPLDGGKPYRFLNGTAHSAAWAPDGKSIAYAENTSIFVSAVDWPAPRLVGMYDATPLALTWSEDGKRLRFILRETISGNPSFWELVFGDGMKTTTLRSLSSALPDSNYWARANRRDAYFVPGNQARNVPVFLVQYGTHFWEPSVQKAQLNLGLAAVAGLAFDRASHRLFALSEVSGRNTFLRFDTHTKEFRNTLPDISGFYLDYSRDGKWVAYTATYSDDLWVSRADETGARQITFQPEHVNLPRWSPDGRQIAFSSKAPNRPWRIYIVDRDTGARREASEGNDNQGAPTWSPDGKFISYGNVLCQATHLCAIHRIDVATGKVETLPGSEGLFTARWSPDGRFIAALHLERHELHLYDVKAGTWRKLADQVAGTDMNWSSDSKVVYADLPGNHARIDGFRVADGRRETVVEMESQERFDLANNDDLGFSLAPDNSVILHRRMHSSEIFAYDLQEQ
jgi:Tol biopolymer transport system component